MRWHTSLEADEGLALERCVAGQLGLLDTKFEVYRLFDISFR